MSEKVCTDPEFGNVTLRRSPRARRITLRVSPSRGIVVTVPWLCSYQAGLAFLDSRRDWVRRTQKRLREKAEMARSFEGPLKDASIEELRSAAKKYLPGKLDMLAKEYGYTYNKVFIKHNLTNWGSCSTKGNINLNLNLVRVPELLCDYVILHELTHLHEMNHGPRFHAELERVCAARLEALRLSGDPFALSLPSDAPVHRLLQRLLSAWTLV